MIMNGTSEHRFLKMMAIASVLVTALGACQKGQETATVPPAEQNMKTPSPDQNTTGNTPGVAPQTQNSPGAGQKNE